MFINTRAHLDFLDIDCLLLLTCKVGLFLGLIFVLTVIEKFANRRVAIWRNLDQIHAGLYSQCQRLSYSYNSVIFPFFVDETNAGDFDKFISARALTGWLRIKGWASDLSHSFSV